MAAGFGRNADGTVARLPREYTGNGPEEETFTPQACSPTPERIG